MYLKHIPLSPGSINILFMVLLLGAWISCRSETSASPGAEIVELEEFETLVAVEDDLLGTPCIIRYGGDSTLLVYDAGQSKILKLDGSGDVVNEYGRAGRGPGEIQRVKNIFLTEDHLYVIDYLQYLIHKYDRNGDFISSMDYGAIGGVSSIPPPPFSPSLIRAENINNQPFVTLQGQVLLSSVRTGQTVQTIYELIDWEGNHISDIGEVPEGSAFVINYDKLRSAIEHREVPAFYKPNAFPVNDHANPEEYFLIYSAIPRIAKYNSSGRKLWETEVIRTPKIDSITNRFYETMERMQQSDPRSRIGLEYYVSGVSSPEGGLFLAVHKSHYFMHLINRPLWIHRFNAEGELIRKYKLMSEDVDLYPIFDVDTHGRRIFVVTEEAEIRTYLF